MDADLFGGEAGGARQARHARFERAGDGVVDRRHVAVHVENDAVDRVERHRHVGEVRIVLAVNLGRRGADGQHAPRDLEPVGRSVKCNDVVIAAIAVVHADGPDEVGVKTGRLADLAAHGAGQDVGVLQRAVRHRVRDSRRRRIVVAVLFGLSGERGNGDRARIDSENAGFHVNKVEPCRTHRGPVAENDHVGSDIRSRRRAVRDHRKVARREGVRDHRLQIGRTRTVQPDGAEVDHEARRHVRRRVVAVNLGRIGGGHRRRRRHVEDIAVAGVDRARRQGVKGVAPERPLAARQHRRSEHARRRIARIDDPAARRRKRVRNAAVVDEDAALFSRQHDVAVAGAGRRNGRARAQRRIAADARGERPAGVETGADGVERAPGGGREQRHRIAESRCVERDRAGPVEAPDGDVRKAVDEGPVRRAGEPVRRQRQGSRRAGAADIDGGRDAVRLHRQRAGRLHLKGSRNVDRVGGDRDVARGDRRPDGGRADIESDGARNIDAFTVRRAVITHAGDVDRPALGNDGGRPAVDEDAVGGDRRARRIRNGPGYRNRAGRGLDSVLPTAEQDALAASGAGKADAVDRDVARPARQPHAVEGDARTDRQRRQTMERDGAAARINIGAVRQRNAGRAIAVGVEVPRRSRARAADGDVAAIAGNRRGADQNARRARRRRRVAGQEPDGAARRPQRPVAGDDAAAAARAEIEPARDNVDHARAARNDRRPGEIDPGRAGVADQDIIPSASQFEGQGSELDAVNAPARRTDGDVLPVRREARIVEADPVCKGVAGRGLAADRDGAGGAGRAAVPADIGDAGEIHRPRRHRIAEAGNVDRSGSVGENVDAGRGEIDAGVGAVAGAPDDDDVPARAAALAGVDHRRNVDDVDAVSVPCTVVVDDEDVAAFADQARRSARRADRHRPVVRAFDANDAAAGIENGSVVDRNVFRPGNDDVAARLGGERRRVVDPPGRAGAVGADGDGGEVRRVEGQLLIKRKTGKRHIALVERGVGVADDEIAGAFDSRLCPVAIAEPDALHGERGSRRRLAKDADVARGAGADPRPADEGECRDAAGVAACI